MFDWNCLSKIKLIFIWVVDFVVLCEYLLKSFVVGFYFVYWRNYLIIICIVIVEYVFVYIEILLLNRDLF